MKISSRCSFALPLTVLLNSCNGPDPEITIQNFVKAANAGDMVQQVSLMPEKERSSYGSYVLDIWYPDAEMAHFHLDSIVQAPKQEFGTDTVLYLAWGSEPNWDRAPQESSSLGSGYSSLVTPDELTSEQIAALPRITSQLHFWLVRENESWRITAESDKLGPLYIALDSIRERCGYSEDPRPCVSTSKRILPAIATLRIFPKENLEPTPRSIIESAAILDSLSIEDTDFRRMYNGRGGFFEWYVRNTSTRPIRHVGIRIVDANGSVVSDDAYALNVPANGRASGLEMVHVNYKPPYRYELRTVEGIGEQ